MIDMFLCKALRKIYLLKADVKPNDSYTERFVQFRDQEANNLLLNTITEKFNVGGVMVCKFGTIELKTACCFNHYNTGLSFSDYTNFIHGKEIVFPKDMLDLLCQNAGFFPNSLDLLPEYVRLLESDMSYIDILGSYIEQEKFYQNELGKAKKVNLNGYYAPYLWQNPWTSVLKGKRVLVCHPFTESIEKQYLHRELLFDNTDVLPEFGDLFLVKSVQSIADNDKNLSFKNWFEALYYMEDQIDSYDYDIALIGCGAYGIHLAAHVKRQGKIAIHMGGWLQMLFGIYGNRWLNDQPEFRKFINSNWIRPSENERPNGVEKIENACYW